MKLCLNFLFHSDVVGVLRMRIEEGKKKILFYLAKIYGKKLKLSLDSAILSKLFKEYKAHIKQLENLFAIRKFLKKRFFQ